MKRAAGFVIYRKVSDNIQYLLLQTSYGQHHWTPPKGKRVVSHSNGSRKHALFVGHVDPGESEMITAIRETVEESGIKQEDLKIYEDACKILHYEVRGKPKKVTYWLAELINSNAKVSLSDEHESYKWLSLQDACRYGKYKEMQELLEFCDNYIRSKS